jgi:hypothetical protein
MAELSFKVGRRSKEPITFDIEGNDHEYTFTPPKQAEMVLPMMQNAENELKAAKAAFEWLDMGMSDEDIAHMEARLRDSKDDFDIPHLEDVVSGLVEAVGARPTT